MNNRRLWMFNGLIIIGIGLMLISWFLPWWSCDIYGEQSFGNAVVIHPYGFIDNLGTFASYIDGSAMPAWFGPLMWIYLGICLACLLFSIFSNRKFSFRKREFTLSEFLIGIVGLSYIAVVIVAVIVMAIRTGDFYGTHLIGKTRFAVMEFVEGDVYASLKLGYWLACGVGPLFIVLSILRNKIIGKGVQ